MKYLFTESARKDIAKLNATTSARIKDALLKYLDDPFRYAKKLTNPSLGTYRYRIGEYRVIFDIKDQDIIILRIGHRSNIYRNK